jgi:hypothetical protein
MRTVAIGIALILAVSTPRGSQNSLPLETIIDRASQFALHQRDTLSSVRADETYLQELLSLEGRLLLSRRLQSEIAFVQLTGHEDWLAFRNVISIDGEATGTDTARLEKLFREGAAEEQWRRITEENAIYNLGRLRRTWNVPTLPMHLLMPLHRWRFSFKKVSGGDRGGPWVISYEERGSPTMVRTTDFKPVRVKGRLWISAGDGHLERATLEAEVPVRSELEFVWRFDEKLAAWLPFEMRERYRGVRPDPVGTGFLSVTGARRYVIAGVATYSNYRRFTVDVKIK